MISFIALLLIFRLLTQDIAPITTILVLLQMIIFYHNNFISVGSLIPFYVINNQEFYRIFSSLVLHLDQIHLYFNMMSLLSRGNFIENTKGSEYYIKTILALGIGSNVIYITICYLLHLFQLSDLYFRAVVGFSGVLFGIKLIYDETFAPEYQVIFGMRLMTKYVIYLELLLVSILHPNVSFLGHLCGIITAKILLKLNW